MSGGIFDLFVAETVIRRKEKKPIKTGYLLDLRTCLHFRSTCSANLGWFVRRWTVEVTFEEVRRHLGVETQRQWTDLAILRTTPCLLGLFSIVTLMADRLATDGKLSVRQAAWYRKRHPTFSYALAAVRLHLWQNGNFLRLGAGTETMKIPKALYHRLLSAIVYAT